MKKLKTWQIVLLVIFYPVGLVYLCVWLYNKSKNKVPASSNVQPQQNRQVAPASSDTIRTQPKQYTSTVSTQPKKEPADGEKNYNLFDDIVDNFALCYEYEKPILLLEGVTAALSGNGGKPIEFRTQDEKVAIYLNGAKIGYIFDEATKEMYDDFVKKGWIVLGYINRFSLTENKATYKIGFYKPLDKFLSKQFSLTKISKKVDEFTTREDNLSLCNEGETVDIELGDMDGNYNDRYIVYSSTYEEIGELPTSAETFIDENEHKKITGIINSIDTDDNGKTKAKVTIYLIK